MSSAITGPSELFLTQAIVVDILEEALCTVGTFRPRRRGICPVSCSTNAISRSGTRSFRTIAHYRSAKKRSYRRYVADLLKGSWRSPYSVQSRSTRRRILSSLLDTLTRQHASAGHHLFTFAFCAVKPFCTNITSSPAPAFPTPAHSFETFQTTFSARCTGRVTRSCLISRCLVSQARLT